MGQLIRRTVNGAADRYFLWDRGQLRAEMNGTASAISEEYLYYPGTDQLFAEVVTQGLLTSTYYAVQDVQGNVIGMIGSGGTVETLQYDAWGQLIAAHSSAADTVHIRWKGLYFDGDVGLYFARARWFDPAARRFISEDPLGTDAGLNQYAFAGGDPVNGFDPSGLARAEPTQGGCIGEVGDGVPAGVACGANPDGGGGGAGGLPDWASLYSGVNATCTGNGATCLAQAQTLLAGGTVDNSAGQWSGTINGSDIGTGPLGFPQFLPFDGVPTQPEVAAGLYGKHCRWYDLRVEFHQRGVKDLLLRSA
jgi:RHS repeat-associated protein